MPLDLSAYRQDTDPDDEARFYDDTGASKYLWCRNGPGEADHIFIWTKVYYEEDECVSDQGSSFLKEIADEESYDYAMIHDGTFEKTIGAELRALGYEECSESCWSTSSGEGSTAKLVEYVQNHPRFEHCPEMEV